MRLSDLPEDLIKEIFSRVPLTSLSAVRSTCKKWNYLSKNHILGKAAARKQFRGFMIMNFKVCSMRFHLQGIRKDDDSDFVNPSIKEISILNEVDAYRVFHCDGLLLCETMYDSKLVVWNPYLGKTRWIQDGYNFYRLDMYALGYDNNHNHKILRCLDYFSVVNRSCPYQIYDFSSNSWRDLDVTPEWDIKFDQRGVSLKGNTYFLAQKRCGKWTLQVERFLLCFDFTAERFGPRLSLPFDSYFGELATLSCVREEQLAVLYQSCEICESMEIWVTNKIDPSAVSWSKFLNVNITTLTGFPAGSKAGSFFIDEEEKVAVVFDLDAYIWYKASYYQTAHIIGEDGYIKSVIGDAPDLRNCHPLVVSSYVPSLVQLQINQQGKRKKRGY